MLPLYSPTLPGSTGEIAYLQSGLKVIRNVAQPTLTAYLPDPAQANGIAVIICPGGAYHFLAFEHEGTRVAAWLNQHGIAAFLLKYRLVPTGDDFPQCVGEHLSNPQQMETLVNPLFPQITADGCQAVRLVRQHAKEWNIDPGRVGMMGFSAGGMLTLSVAMTPDPASRPNFAAPIYPAPPLEASIPPEAPPLFLLCAADDDMASAVTIDYYHRWRTAHRPVELHIYAQGGHGFGMECNNLPSDGWIERFSEWLGSLHFD
ncbi:MAG TPA: alpha/beta hydrolase [Anaerolineaceae bacterium]